MTGQVSSRGVARNSGQLLRGHRPRLTVQALLGVLAVLGLSGCGVSSSRGAAVQGSVSIRSVLCSAPDVHRSSNNMELPSTCSVRYRLTARNLDVVPQLGMVQHKISPDPALGSYQSTSLVNQRPNKIILINTSGGGRVLLGRQLMTLSPKNVTKASAEHLFGTGWVVTYTLSPRAGQTWNQIAKEHFHEYLAFVYDGKAVSRSLIEPTNVTFTSFGLHDGVSVKGRQAIAEQLAQAIGGAKRQ